MNSLAAGLCNGQEHSMNTCAISLAGARLQARASGALFWPDQQVLCISDLHLGKSERMARRGGGLLPPYDTGDTLARLDAEIEATRAAHVICLGDSFDDLDAAHALTEDQANWLARLMAGRRWTWIEGNHDPGPMGLGGTHTAALTIGPLVFRHIAKAAAAPGEVSGHYHPKATLHARGRSITRPCFLTDSDRLVLPAFGTYTGGLRGKDPVFDTLFPSGRTAILTGHPMAPIRM